MAKNREFRVIKLCQKLCADIVNMQGTADKRYRFTICQDIRKKSEDVIHLVRRANDLPAGCKDRIEMQKKADDLLEDIKDLLWVVGYVLHTGTAKEAQIELSIESLQQPLRNWIEKDEKIALSMCEKRLKVQSWKLYQAKVTYELVVEYHKKVGNGKTSTALEQSKSRYRIEYNAYKSLIHEYDYYMESIMVTQERFHKDETVLGEVLKDIEKKTGKKLPKLNEPVSNEIIKEKKEAVNLINKQIAEIEKDTLSETMVYRLK